MTQQNMVGMVTIDYRFNKSLTLIFDFAFFNCLQIGYLECIFFNANTYLHHKFNMQQINIENHVKFVHS